VELTGWIERKVIINFVCDYWQFVFLGNRDDFLHVVKSETRSTGVRRVINQNSSGSVSDLCLDAIDVSLPLLVSQKVVMAPSHTKVLADRLEERESGSGN